MRFSRSLPLVLVLALVASACGDDGGAADDDDGVDDTTTTAPVVTTTEADPTEIPVVVPMPVERECDVDAEVATGVECWWIEVPVDHDDPSGPTYDLAATVLRSPAGPAAPPVVYLSGGPGYPGGNPNFWGSSGFVEDRDVIVYDQRGTGGSNPDLQCPEIETVNISTLLAPDPFAVELAARDAAAVECHTRLLAAGVDLDRFSTTASAHDLDLIRRALGYDRWQLFGISYGTRLALETMRQHPEGLDAVVLDSVYPTTAGAADDITVSADRVFTAFGAACGASPTCQAEHPTLAADLLAVFDIYNAAPIELSLEVDGTLYDFVLTGDDVAAGLFNALYDTELIPLLPDVVGSFLDGDTSLATVIAQDAISFVNGAAEAMAIATNCADNQPRADEDDWAVVLADAGRYGTLQIFNPASACPVFPVASEPAAFGEPVRSDVPTLVTAGSLDPITPPAGSEAVATTLTNATYIEFAPVGHGAVLALECAEVIARSFLAAPTEPVVTECAEDIGGPFD